MASASGGKGEGMGRGGEGAEGSSSNFPGWRISFDARLEKRGIISMDRVNRETVNDIAGIP